jgi:hypothetical protein
MRSDRDAPIGVRSSDYAHGTYRALPSPMLRLALSFFAVLSFAACGGQHDALVDGARGDGGDRAEGGDAASSVDAGHASDAGDAGDASARDAGARADGGIARSKKRGIAYGGHSDADLAALSVGVSFWYNWSPHPESSLATKSYTNLGVDFVPMIWGGSFDPNALASEVPAGAKYLLTFNEPNFGSQSNLTPAQAAALWPKVEAFARARGLAIVSPALNYCGGNCNATNPFDWLDRFFAACPGCQIDYVAAHWYACNESALVDYLAQYKTKYKKPLWLTEFSCLDDTTITLAKEQQYMKDAVAVLEADPMVFRYAWFTGRYAAESSIDLLATTSGTLTPLGRQYVSLPSAP